ncbi:hypothetical protein CH063_06743, partial [Colletotrichum higginsianum]
RRLRPLHRRHDHVQRQHLRPRPQPGPQVPRPRHPRRRPRPHRRLARPGLHQGTRRLPRLRDSNGRHSLSLSVLPAFAARGQKTPIRLPLRGSLRTSGGCPLSANQHRGHDHPACWPSLYSYLYLVFLDICGHGHCLFTLEWILLFSTPTFSSLDVLDIGQRVKRLRRKW